MGKLKKFTEEEISKKMLEDLTSLYQTVEKIDSDNKQSANPENSPAKRTSRFSGFWKK